MALENALQPTRLIEYYCRFCIETYIRKYISIMENTFLCFPNGNRLFFALALPAVVPPFWGPIGDVLRRRRLSPTRAVLPGPLGLQNPENSLGEKHSRKPNLDATSYCNRSHLESGSLDAIESLRTHYFEIFFAFFRGRTKEGRTGKYCPMKSNRMFGFENSFCSRPA